MPAKLGVSTVNQVLRQGAADTALRLDGEDLTLISLHINDQPWSDYKLEESQLVISALPERFTLHIVNEISPAANSAHWKGYTSPVMRCAPSLKPRVSAILLGIPTVRTCWRALLLPLSPTRKNILSCSPTVIASTVGNWRTVVTG